MPDLDDLVDALDEGGEIDFSSLDWDPEAEAEFLDGVLGNLYLLTVGEDGPGESPVPLPALAASMIVPDDMGEPTNDVLEQVSDAMMRLDDQFRLLEPVGLVEYQPVDEALMADIDEEPAPPVDDTDVTRYGMVRLTPLGCTAARAAAGVRVRGARGGRPRGQGRGRAARRYLRVSAGRRARRDRAVARPGGTPRRRTGIARGGARAPTRGRRCGGCAASRRCRSSVRRPAGAARGPGRRGAGRARPGVAHRAGRLGRARAVRGDGLLADRRHGCRAARGGGQLRRSCRRWSRGWPRSTAGSSRRRGGWITPPRRTCWRRWGGCTPTRGGQGGSQGGVQGAVAAGRLRGFFPPRPCPSRPWAPQP